MFQLKIPRGPPLQYLIMPMLCPEGLVETSTSHCPSSPTQPLGSCEFLLLQVNDIRFAVLMSVVLTIITLDGDKLYLCMIEHL